MSFLYGIQDTELVPAHRSRLSNESQIESWVEKNPALIGLDALIIGRQVQTDHGTRIDLLAMDNEGGLIVIELKRDKTPRDIVAQALDYGSWVKTLSTPRVHELAGRYFDGESLATKFRDKFDKPLPEPLNTHHTMMIIASEFDAASCRIVEYLSETHDVPINTAFFSVFEANSKQWLVTDFLLDQSEVEDRAERKQKAPWTGAYFVNVGDGEWRAWEDMRRFGFVSSGGGEFYSKRLDQLQAGDRVYAYQKGAGYVGKGTVTGTKIPAGEFMTPSGPLFDQDLKQPAIRNRSADAAVMEYAVPIDWETAVPISDAKTFVGVFANQNIVCKLRDPETLAFLKREFGD